MAYHHSEPVRTAFGRPLSTRTNDTPGLGLLFLLFLLVPLFLGGTWWGAVRAGAPNPVLLGWPAVFLTQGWLFLDDGFDPPVGVEGISVGFVVCGVVFALMGAAPLLLLLAAWRGHARPGQRRPARRPAGSSGWPPCTPRAR
jgi:ABC-type nitrate/sulfonate/bicarbonate transport system permease component